MIPKIFVKRPSVFMLLSLVVVLMLSFGWILDTPTFMAHNRSILRLPVLGSWKNIPLIFSRDFLAFTDGQFRPLSYAVLAIVHTLIRTDNTVFWHLWLLFFHLLNAVLLFLVVKHFTKRSVSAAFAALIFGLHPLASVVVNNINYFHYVLGLTFYLGALLSYLSFARQSGKRLYVLTTILFVLGILTSKVVFTFLIVLGLYEWLYCRSGFQRVLARLLPLVIISIALSPLWLFYKPHPIYYKYIDFPSGASWYSFFSAVGATGWYLKGLLFGRGVPVVLREVVEHILRFPHWRFLLWGMIDVGIIVVGGWLLRRKRWLGLGLIFIFVALIPFATTAWNGVDDYVHWAYLYIPTVGLTLFVVGLADELWSSQRRRLQKGILAVLFLLIVFYGAQQIRSNLTHQSAVSYWNRALRLNPDSEVASRELGKTYLRKGKMAEALQFLFSPAIKHIQPSCLIVSRYYCEKGDYAAAAVHLRMSIQEKLGLQYQEYELVAAELLYAIDALDYVEESLGLTLMANPYNLRAMTQLTEVWLSKGYVPAAERLGDQAMALAPHHPFTNRIHRKLKAYQNSLASFNVPQIIHPPKAIWLRYVTQGISNPQLRQEIVQLSERYETDPVIQIEGGIYLVMEGHPQKALPKLDFATRSLSSCAYAWAMKCWAAAEAGDYQIAEKAGDLALKLDPHSPTVQHILGVLASKQIGSRQSPEYRRKLEQSIRHFRRTIQLNPRHAASYNRLANLLVKEGKLEEAVEYYRRALRLKSKFAQAHYNLGVALLQQGKNREAMGHFQQALQIDPGYAQAHNNLGAALIRMGSDEKAIDHFQQALQLKPDYSMARKNLVATLVKQHKFRRAIFLLQQGLTQMPDDVGLTLDLAWLLVTCPESKLRNGAKALQLAQRACQAGQNRDARALDVLAAAYAETGRFQRAVQVGEQALELALSSGRSDLAKQIETHLKLYRSHQPIHAQP